MEWNEELALKFALFHSQRMKGAYQTDGEFYVNQSMQIFTEENVKLRKPSVIVINEQIDIIADIIADRLLGELGAELSRMTKEELIRIIST